MKKNGKRNGKKSTVFSTVPVGALVPQPHGGAIRNGGTNRGGPGRPKDIVREAFLLSGAARRPVLETIADGKLVERYRRVGASGEPIEVETSAGASERIRAVEALLKVGLSSDPPATGVGLHVNGPVQVIVRYDDDRG